MSEQPRGSRHPDERHARSGYDISTATRFTKLAVICSPPVDVELLPLSTHDITFRTALSRRSLTWWPRPDWTANDLADTLIAYTAYARCSSKGILQQPWPATVGAEDLEIVGLAAKG